MQKSGTIYHFRKRRKIFSNTGKNSAINGVYFYAALVVTTIFLLGQVRIAGSISNGIKNIMESPTPTPTVTMTPSPTPTPVNLPTRLVIDKLRVDAEVELAGVDENGLMQNPQNWNNVAWFKAGPLPGEFGSSVIAGHYDTNRGAPAVFYNLGKLDPGDIIKVSKMDGSVADFVVSGKEVYPFNDAPLDYLFKSREGSKLILITCNGWFNTKIRTYSNRIVIFADLL